jgi:hypothetical protein
MRLVGRIHACGCYARTSDLFLMARIRRPAMRSRLNLFVATTAAILTAPSLAIAEPPAGTKNFNAPDAAPNYFSNESGPVMRQPAPLPAAPQAPARTSRETEEPEGQVEAAAPNAERQVSRTVKGREPHRTAHADSKTSGRLKSTAARGQNARPARVEKPRAAKVSHAAPHATKVQPVSAKGRAGRG